jgi:hypothetical protein
MVVGFGMNALLGPGAGIRALSGVLIGTIVIGLFVAIAMCTCIPPSSILMMHVRAGSRRIKETGSRDQP